MVISDEEMREIRARVERREKRKRAERAAPRREKLERMAERANACFEPAWERAMELKRESERSGGTSTREGLRPSIDSTTLKLAAVPLQSVQTFTSGAAGRLRFGDRVDGTRLRRNVLRRLDRAERQLKDIKREEDQDLKAELAACIEELEEMMLDVYPPRGGGRY